MHRESRLEGEPDVIFWDLYAHQTAVLLVRLLDRVAHAEAHLWDKDITPSKRGRFQLDLPEVVHVLGCVMTRSVPDFIDALHE